MTLKDDEFWKPVITTHQILAGNDVIVVVNLDDEGDWQALGDEEPTDDDLEVVSVEDILILDPTLNTLPDLQPGQSAERASVEEAWEIVD